MIVIVDFIALQILSILDDIKGEYPMTIKVLKQGNSLMISLPKFLNVSEGDCFDIRKLDNGTIELVPISKIPESMEELFEGWNGKYQSNSEMKEWDNIQPKGNELL